MFFFVSLIYCYVQCVGIMKTYWKTPNCGGDYSFRTYVHEDRCVCFQDDYASKFDIGTGSGCARMQLEHHEGRQREMIETFRTFWDCDHDNPYSYEENENYENFGLCEDRGYSFYHGDLEYRSFKANRVPWFSWFAANTPVGKNDLADLYYQMEECDGNHVFAVIVKDYYPKALEHPNKMRFKPGDCPGSICLESLPNREGRGSVLRGCGVQPWSKVDYSFIVVIIGISFVCFIPVCGGLFCCILLIGFFILLQSTKFPVDRTYDSDEEVIVIDSDEEIEVLKKKHKRRKKKKRKRKRKRFSDVDPFVQVDYDDSYETPGSSTYVSDMYKHDDSILIHQNTSSDY